jgi:hypothetical protein
MRGMSAPKPRLRLLARDGGNEVGAPFHEAVLSGYDPCQPGNSPAFKKDSPCLSSELVEENRVSTSGGSQQKHEEDGSKPAARPSFWVRRGTAPMQRLMLDSRQSSTTVACAANHPAAHTARTNRAPSRDAGFAAGGVHRLSL